MHSSHATERLLATGAVALGLALAGCGGASQPTHHQTQQSVQRALQKQCATWHAYAMKQAQSHYDNQTFGDPNNVTLEDAQAFAEAAYRQTAAKLGVKCR